MLVATLGQGINAAMSRWGQVLQTWHGTTRMAPEDDLVSTRLGAWTDNGGGSRRVGHVIFRPNSSLFFHQATTTAATR